MTRKRFIHYNVDDLKVAVEDAICWTDVCRAVNVTCCTYNFKRLQQLCLEHNLDTSHFNRVRAMRRNKRIWTDEEVFVENCTITRSMLRRVLIRLGFYSGGCQACGISDTWNDKPLTIEIDHANGIHTDNRRENLRWLCPNCHSQTSTYRRRNE